MASQQQQLQAQQQQQQLLTAGGYNHHNQQDQQQAKNGGFGLPMAPTVTVQQNMPACPSAAVTSSWQLSPAPLGMSPSQGQALQGQALQGQALQSQALQSRGSPLQQPQQQQQYFTVGPTLDGVYSQSAAMLASGGLSIEPLMLQHSGTIKGDVDSLMHQLHLN
jgi:hypothetical protein